MVSRTSEISTSTLPSCLRFVSKRPRWPTVTLGERGGLVARQARKIEVGVALGGRAHIMVSLARTSVARASTSGCSVAGVAPTQPDRVEVLQANPGAGEDLGLAIERQVIVIFRRHDCAMIFGYR